MPKRKPRKREPSVWVLERLHPDGEWRIPINLAAIPAARTREQVAEAWAVTAQSELYRVAEYRRVKPPAKRKGK